MEGQIKYNTSVYMWGDIKECIDSLGVKIPPQLEHKNDDDPIQFVVYPGRSKELFLASPLMCITLDKDQSPIGVFFFENQTDLLQSSESSESEGEGESKLCKSNSGYKIDNDEDSDKKEKRKTEKLDEAPKAPSYEIKPSGQVTPRSYVVDPKCKKSVTELKAVKSVTMSFKTKKTLIEAGRKGSAQLIKPDNEAIARKVLDILDESFVKDTDFSYSWKGGKTGIPFDLFIRLASIVRDVVKDESTFMEFSSPTYVFGDIHGNYTDLMRFSKMLGMHKASQAMPARYLFLGDYVDRGDHSVEVVAYLFAMKVLYPKRIFLLRGNHELQTTNCSYQNYGKKCFHGMCTAAYGEEQGNNAWWSAQYVFRNLPIAASIDKRIFCVHGGIPRFIRTDPDVNIVEKITSLKRPWDTEFNVKLDDFLKNKDNQLIFDLLWSDPAIDPIDPSDKEKGFPDGFGESERGPNTCVFSSEVLMEFYAKTGFTHIIRAHEAVTCGVDMRVGGTLLTVFSSSCNDDEGDGAAILVNDGKLKAIIMKPI